MANISLEDPNFVFIDNYFYTINDTLQILVKKTFDGTIAFCYTLDIPVGNQVLSLDYDGVSFWSLEQGSSRVVIRKLQIENLMCIQKDKIEIIGGPSEIIEGSTFAIEHYATKFSGLGQIGHTTFNMANVDKLAIGQHIVLGPNSNGQTEEKIVDSIVYHAVTVTVALSYEYALNDPIKFSKNGYYFNDVDGTDTSTGRLYKVDLDSHSVVPVKTGTHFKGVTSAVFGEVKDKNGEAVCDFNGDGNNNIAKCIMFIKGDLMMFLDLDSYETPVNMITDLNSATVYDLTLNNPDGPYEDFTNLNGSTIYMLKSGYNYEVAQFDRMVNSISVTASPAILPADGASTSTIRASVLDQYDRPFASPSSPKTVTFSKSGPGSVSPESSTTNEQGIATVNYIAGDTVADATITALVHQS